MGMLDKAKDSKGEKPEEKKKKKHKHPSAQASQPVDDGADAGSDDEAGGGQEPPDADAGESEAPDSQGGAVAASDPSAPPDQEAQDDQGSAAGGDPAAQAQGQGGAQGGPPPVVNAQAPGAGDDSSGGDDSPSPADDATDPGGDAPAGAASAEGGAAGATMQQVPMSPALKEEYQNLDRMLVQKLYHGGVAEQILPSLMPQGPHKIKGVVTMAVLLAREVFIASKAPQQLTLPFARDCAAHVMQVGEQVKGIQYSDQECTAIIGAVYEGMLRAFGVKKSQFSHMQGLIPRSQFAHHAKNYITAHGHAQQANSANAVQDSHEHVDQAQPQGPDAQAGGPQAAQGAPPAAGGGMIQQGADAAAAQPQPGAQPQAGAQ